MADTDLLPMDDDQNKWQKVLGPLMQQRPPMDSRMVQAAPVSLQPLALNMNPTGTPTTAPDTALKIPGNDGLKSSDSVLATPSLTGGLKTPDVTTTQPDYNPPAMSGMLRDLGKASTPPQKVGPHGFWRDALGVGLSALAGKDAGQVADEYFHGAQRRADAAANQAGEQQMRQAQIDNIRSEIANRGADKADQVAGEPFVGQDGKLYQQMKSGEIRPATVGGQQLTRTPEVKGGEFKQYTIPGNPNPVLAREMSDGRLLQRDGTALPNNAILKEPSDTAKGPKNDLQQRIADAFEKGDKATVAKLQKELKAIDPEGAERLNISMEGLSDREKNEATKLTENQQKAIKPYQDTLDGVADARELAKSPSPTNDAALIQQFMGITKPESMGKMRFQIAEQKFILGTRSSLGDMEALFQKVVNGQMLTPKQRHDMLETLGVFEKAAQRRMNQEMSNYNKSGGASETQQYNGFNYTKQKDGTWKKGDPVK